MSEDLQEGARRLEKYAAFVFYLPAYLAVRRYIREPGRPFLVGLSLAPFGEFAFGLDWDFTHLFSVLTLRERLVGFYNTIILGDISVLLTLLLLSGVVLFAKSWRTLLVGGGLVLLGLIVVTATASRNALLFIPIGMVAALLLLRKYLNRRHGYVLGVVVLMLSGLLLISPQNVVVDRIANGLSYWTEPGSGKDFEVSARFAMWRDSISMWTEAPVFGVGLGDFELETARLIAEGRSGTTVVFGHAHSIYFDALATTGLIGFVVMLWFAFWRPFHIGWTAWRSADTRWQTFYATGIVLTVIGFMVFGLTEAWFSRNPMVRTYLMCLLIMMCGLAGAQGEGERPHRPA
ncbi:MAG: hypothetical protein Kow0096_11260 [Thiohalomonadaceae bacterium]